MCVKSVLYIRLCFIAAGIGASLSNGLLATQSRPGSILGIIDDAITVQVDIQPHNVARLDHNAHRIFNAAYGNLT